VGGIGWFLLIRGGSTTTSAVAPPAATTNESPQLPKVPPRLEGDGAGRRGQIPPPERLPVEPGKPRRPRPGEPAPEPAKLPPAPDPLPISATPIPEDGHTIALPGQVARIASGGGGRFIAMTFADPSNTVAVFDLNQAKIPYTIEMPAGEVWPPAGMRSLVLYSPTEKKLRRHDLLTGKLEREQDYDPGGEVVSVVMGAASAGPLM